MKKILIVIYIATSLIYISLWNYNNFQILTNTESRSSTNNDLLLISNQIYNISIQQIQIWKNITNNSIDNTNMNTLSTLNELRYLYEIDIITLLDLSKDKNEALINYLFESEKAIAKSEYLIYDIESKIKTSRANLEECSKEKKQSDKGYFEALEKQDTITMQSTLETSKNSDVCISRNRIDINANQIILNRIKTLREILLEKYKFLKKEQYIIKDNFEIIKTNLAEELYQITKILNQYNIE